MPSSVRPHALLGLLAWSVLGCGPPTEVVIETRIGEQQARQNADSARAAASSIAQASQRWWTEQAQARSLLALAGSPDAAETDAADAPDDPGVAEPSPKPAAIAYVPAPPTNVEQLDALIEALRSGPLDEVGLITRNLALADPSLWPDIHALLIAERKHPKREYKQVLDVIGGDVPNRYGHFDLHWKQAHGYAVRVSEDWFEDLLGVEPARISKPVRPVFRETLLTVALLRAASHAATAEPKLVPEIVAALLDVAYVHEGTFRDEVGRAVDAIGDPAIPHLLRESVPSDSWKDDSVEARRAAYASYCLDRMDRLHPSRAIAAVSGDRRLLADTLAAYALVRDGDAASLLLDWVDADAPGVRQAARTAFEAYVVGPTPQVRRKSIRLFNGAVSTQQAGLSYREYARLAIRARLAEHEPELLEPECKLWLAGGIVDAECEGQPERLFRAYLERLDERRLVQRDAIVAQALSTKDHAAGAALLDTLLADSAEGLAPATIGAFYVDVANEAQAIGDRPRAAQLLRKSAMLLAETEPEAARNLTVEALMLEAQANGVDPAGKAMLLGTAQDLAPESNDVAVAIAALDEERGRSTAPLRKHLALALLGLMAILALLSRLAARIHRPTPF